MKYKLIILFSVIFALVALSGSASVSGMQSAPAPAVSTSSLSATVSVQHYVYENETFYLNVTESSGYHNYSLAAYLGAVNDTGLSPLSYYSNSTTGKFSIPVTAPAECEGVYGYIDAYAINSTGHRITYTTSLPTINVSKPVIFNATVENTDPVPIYNITLTYTVTHGTSSQAVGISHIDEIKGNSTYTDNITAPSALIYKGKDTLTVTTNNPVITLKGKSSVVFYNGAKPNYDWVYYIAAVAIAFAIFLIVASGRRNTVRVPKWKRSKSNKKTQKAQKTK